MASFKLYLDTRSPRKDGSSPLKIMIHHKKAFFINLNVYCKPENFIAGEVLIPDEPRRQKNTNDYIKARLVHVENTLNKLTLLGKLKDMSHTHLKRFINDEPEQEQSRFIVDHWNRFIRDKGNGTKGLHIQTQNKIDKYCNLDTLEFTDITASWLKDFDSWMSKTCSTNTRSIHLRNIRAVFNDAIDEDVIEQNFYPFRKFKIKRETTQKRSLSLDELKILRDFKCEPHQEKYRDIFMLIFYLIGINMVDLVNLKSIEKGRVEFKRAKTGRLYSIKVESEAQKIIDKYKGKNYLLNVLDSYSNHLDFLKKTNTHLKQIGECKIVPRKNGRPGKKEYTGIYPNLTTYWARHTWATLAASIDIPKETIAAALGHGGNTTTDIYIDFDQKKVDAANRKVIDLLSN